MYRSQIRSAFSYTSLLLGKSSGFPLKGIPLKLDRGTMALFTNSYMFHSQSCVLLSYGFGKARNGAPGRHKSFAEKQADKGRKNREERRQCEEQLDEANEYVAKEFVDRLDEEVEKTKKFCTQKLLELKNIPSALESLEIDLHGQRRPLVQCGIFQRPSPDEMVFIPNVPNCTNAVLLRLTKFSHELFPSKAEDGRVKLRIPKLTRARRDAVKEEISQQENACNARMRGIRSTAIRELKEIFPSMTSEHEMVLLDALDSSVKEKEIILKELIQECCSEALTAESLDVHHSALN